jgi:predicted oxidoreductase
MSDIVVGTMRWGIWDAKFTTAQYEAMIDTSMSLGMSTFDHADIYGDYTTEAEFGAALKLHPEWRSQMELVTKCGIIRVCDQKPEHYIKAYNFTKSHILQSAEDSLRNLQTDYLDVMLLHRPDLLMDPDEVAEAFELLYTSGKVRSFGVSNFTPSQVKLLQSTVPVGVHQLEVSVKDVSAFDDGRLDQCALDGIVPMAWSPLGGGTLPNEMLTVLEPLATAFEVTPQAIALAWLLQHSSGILPVVGTTKAENLEAAQAALNIKLDRQQWYTIYQAATGTTLP